MSSAALNGFQTPFDNFPSSPSDGDVYLNKWVSYTYSETLSTWVSDQINESFTYSSDNNVWELKTPESKMDTIMYFSLTGDKKVALTEGEYQFDHLKTDLEHRIYVQKTIALQHGTEEEFADYFSQLDAMLEADDPMQVNFPPAPFQE